MNKYTLTRVRTTRTLHASTPDPTPLFQHTPTHMYVLFDV